MELILILVIFCLLLFLWIFYPWESVRTSKFKRANESKKLRELIEDKKRGAKDHPLD
jgi:hypothetical protein